jgi:DNA transposition AAA+ family ATPase
LHQVFCHTVSNVSRLLAGIAIVQERGAAEACQMLVTGQPGLGKTETLGWYVTQQPYAVYLRAKSGWTRHWFLNDLLAELGEAPTRLTEDMFKQALAALARKPYILVVDEVEHALNDTRVLEAIRDFSDLLRLPTVLVGMAEVRNKIARHPQVQSRIATIVTFQPATLEDVKATAQMLLEGGVAITDDVAELIHTRSEGRMRLVLNGLAACERVARLRKTKTVGLAEVKDVELVHDWQSRKPQTLKPQARGAKDSL